jgi:magnesium-protoporphyrin O-methyltransferase
MTSATYQKRLSQLEHYFDRTAAEAWSRLTSDAPVSGIRATVRAGRDRMRATLLSWLPADLSGRRLLDAGCGTGALAVEAARRGAEVVAIDLSPTLVALAQERLPADLVTGHGAGSIDFRVGDMLRDDFGAFDHVVAMDSLIHYEAPDMVRMLDGLADRLDPRTRDASVVFTFAPRTPALTAMHAVGRLFPRGDRAPAIEPVAEPALRRRIEAHDGLAAWRPDRTERIVSGFYTSQAMELVAR